VLRAAFRLGLIDAEHFARASDVPPVRGTRIPKGRALSRGELRALFEACDPCTNSGARDAALLALLYGAGLRRAEAIALDLSDFDAVAGTLVVRGKGNKERTAYVTNGSREALDAWLSRRGQDVGPLFLPVNKADRIERRRLSDQTVAAITHRVAKRAAIQSFSPHDMRRSFIGDALDAGADLPTVQGLAGHASPTTTSRYDRRGERVRRQAAELLHVPFAGGAR
jgi:site-specific recombinase XerD